MDMHRTMHTFLSSHEFNEVIKICRERNCTQQQPASQAVYVHITNNMYFMYCATKVRKYMTEVITYITHALQ